MQTIASQMTGKVTNIFNGTFGAKENSGIWHLCEDCHGSSPSTSQSYYLKDKTWTLVYFCLDHAQLLITHT